MNINSQWIETDLRMNKPASAKPVDKSEAPCGTMSSAISLAWRLVCVVENTAGTDVQCRNLGG